MHSGIKKTLKSIPAFSKVGYSYRELKTKKRMLAYQDTPTEWNKIVFATTGGRYNDSCCAIAEYMHMRKLNVKMVWVCKDRKYVGEVPTYITPVMYGSDEYYEELSTASVWVFSYLIPQGTIKRNNQLYIQVWHGDKGFKKIASEAAAGNALYRRRTSGRRLLENDLCDYLITSSISFIDVWRRSVGYEGKVIDSGLPRNDVLLQNHDLRVRTVREELGIPKGTKVLLYAPTFRDHHIDNGNIGTDLDLNAALSMLRQKYEGNWLCLKRAHGGKRLIMPNTSDSADFMDVSCYRDMTDLLLITDILITDYSSCAGDFAYLNRPIILYQDDYDDYVQNDRGLLFEMESSPFFRATNMDELRKIIYKLDSVLVYSNCAQILEFYQSCQTDHSTRDVTQIILKHIRQKV